MKIKLFGEGLKAVPIEQFTHFVIFPFSPKSLTCKTSSFSLFIGIPAGPVVIEII